jgi:epoxyqueuosine reductase
MNENDPPLGPPAALPDLAALARGIRAWGQELGFGALGIARASLPEDEAWLKRWLALGRHGEMAWMARHGTRRSRPAELVPGTLTVIAARMDYLPPGATAPERVLAEPRLGYISRYALGRDYHKVLRARLQRLADRIGAATGPFGYRVFSDSAPVLEKALARDAGLGWIGKHTNLLSRDAGSWFFLGEIYTDLPLPTDVAPSAHCGRCTACIEACPTGAIVAPYELDARLCISYLTIEHPGPIPEPLRPALGNRIYGCDDCQLVCPWNRYAQLPTLADFQPRDALDAPTLSELFSWSEQEFLARTAGSAIRRIGHERWLRNVAVALGNAAPDPGARSALMSRTDDLSGLVREHVRWALERHERYASR